MNWPKTHNLPYYPTSACYFTVLRDFPWPIFLDSGRPDNQEGRYDILSAAPYATLVTFGKLTEIHRDNFTTFSSENPFELIQNLLGEVLSNPTSLPFIGGAMGYFAYDLNKRLEKLSDHTQHDIALPDMAIGLYDWAIVVDHHEKCTTLVQGGRVPHAKKTWQQLVTLFSHATFNESKLQPHYHTTAAKSNMSFDQYAAALQQIKHHIVEGDCYQINLAQRFTSEVAGNAWEIYCQMRTHNPVPFGAFFQIDQGSVLSFSPERFIQIENDTVQTMPIKGTRPRDIADSAHDNALAQELLNSEKDRAENVMIVDLLRNDLGKNCEIGSVAVPALCELKSYTHVHHLVSTVVGKVPQDCHRVKILCDAFPGGSITGAPKIRAMEIIDSLEPHRRSVYCGAMGYISYSKHMDTNIAIRTVVRVGNALHYWAGGGIVYDSQLEDEYKETLAKAKGFLAFCKGFCQDS